MSPGKRGGSAPKSGRAGQPSINDTQPDQNLDAAPADTPPAEPRPSRRRRSGVARSINAEPHEAPRGNTAPAPESAPELEPKDAWADYEEDANDWVLTDEHAIAPAPLARATGRGMGTTDELHSAVPAPTRTVPDVGATAAVDAIAAGSASADVASTLQGLTGQDAGRSFAVPAAALQANRIRLGRGTDNDVVLSDPSISRMHAELLRNAAETWEIIDLQSGNGTFVNGVRAPRQAFAPGTPLGLGTATYRLVTSGKAALQPLPPTPSAVGPLDPAAAAARSAQAAEAAAVAAAWQPAVAPTPEASADRWALPRLLTQGPVWLRAVLLAAATGTALVAAAASWHMLRVWDIVGPLHTAIFEHYVQGVDALTGHRWADAERAFAAVLEADPKSVRGKAYLEATGVAKRDAHQLDVAQRALAAGNLAQAYAASEGLEDGLFHAEGRVLRQSVVARVTVQIDRAHQALEAGHIQEAQDLIAEIEAIVPHRPDVALLRSRADASLGMLVSEAPPRPSGGNRGPRPPRPILRRRSGPLTGPLAEAVREFNDGNADAALTAMAAEPGADAQQLAQATRAFVHAYETGLAEHRGKRAFNAIQALTQAKNLEARIGGGHGKLAAAIDLKLADMYYVMGMQAYARSQWAEAGEAWRQAIERVPNHALSRRKLEELDEKAKGLLNEANDIKAQDTEKARSLLRQAAQMAPAGSDLAARARRLGATLR